MPDLETCGGFWSRARRWSHESVDTGCSHNHLAARNSKTDQFLKPVRDTTNSQAPWIGCPRRSFAVTSVWHRTGLKQKAVSERYGHTGGSLNGYSSNDCNIQPGRLSGGHHCYSCGVCLVCDLYIPTTSITRRLWPHCTYLCCGSSVDSNFYGTAI
jgi:hypothetical protein